MTHPEPSSVENGRGVGDSSQDRVGGVDGVRGGWVMAIAGAWEGSPVEEILVRRSFRDLWCYAHRKGLAAVAVDIPIGLPCGGDRVCDGEARDRLRGPPNRASSVFNAPPLCAIDAGNFEKAVKSARKCADKGVSKQSYALFPKIKEVRKVLQPQNLVEGAQPRAAEAHPEVSFQAMAGKPMRYHKSRQAGVAERLAYLQLHFSNIVDVAVRTQTTGPPDPGLDDVLDAVAAAWTARRAVSGTAVPLGGLATDRTGLPMTIWA